MPPSPPPRHDRKTLRTLVLLGLLILAALGAWAMVRSGDALSAQGADLVAELWQRGLASWWSDEPEVHWWLRTAEGDISGFAVEYRHRLADGRFQGGQLRVQAEQSVAQRYFSRWTLTPDASQGTYTGQSILELPNGQTVAVDAKIEMTPQKLLVDQRMNGQVLTSSALVPSNYIPEGTMDLLVGLAAERGTEARFVFISDSQPPRGRRPDFVKHTVSPASVDPDGQRIVEVSFSGGSTERITLDDSGQVILREGDGWQERRVAAEEVARHSPQARQLLDEQGVPAEAAP